MWTCQNCHETNEQSFGECGNCGTTQDGIPDPQFEKVQEPSDEVDDSTNSGYLTETMHFFFRDVVVVIFLIGIFVALLSWLLQLTNGDWALAMPIAIVCIAIVLWRCLSARCSNCGRWWRKSSTGAFRKERGLEEFECKHCGKTEWKRRLQGSGGGG